MKKYPQSGSKLVGELAAGESGIKGEKEFLASLEHVDQGAKRAFQKLVNQGMAPATLVAFIQAATYGEAILDLKLPSTVPEGKSEGETKRFPDRILKFAAEIREFNASPIFNPVSVRLEGLGGDRIGRVLWGLPRLLTLYAAHVENLTKGNRRPPASQNIEREIKDGFQLMLLDLVRMATGMANYGAVAILLTAAFRADGQARSISEEALKKKYLRKKNHRLAREFRYRQRLQRLKKYGLDPAPFGPFANIDPVSLKLREAITPNLGPSKLED